MSNTHPFSPELDAIIIGAGMSGCINYINCADLDLKHDIRSRYRRWRYLVLEPLSWGQV